MRRAPILPHFRLRYTILAGVLCLAGGRAHAECPGYSICPSVKFADLVAHNAGVRGLIAAIDAQESVSLQGLSANGLSFGQLVALLGQALVFDKSLSVRGNEACAFCHSPAAGFAGGVPAFAPAGGVFPGSLMNRTGFRAPPSLAYAAFSPVLSLGPDGAFAGGTFWDGRATGLVTGSPVADQVVFPLTDAAEMALPDPACAVRRVALAPYAIVFGKVWGTESLNLKWPKDTDTVCAHANDGGADQAPLQLDAADRARAAVTVQQMGVTIATFEESTLASAFTSKFDAVLARKAEFSSQEKLGYALFTGRANCAVCHDTAGARPLLTNFAFANIGIPRNPALPFLVENEPDRLGYVANPAGSTYLDAGLGRFLASDADTNQQWRAVAAGYVGTFQVPTLRNVVARPVQGFTRTYMHNGSFASLRMVVHFYNTRDVLPHCSGTQGEGVTCWPAPEEPVNVNTTLMGKLGLSNAEENALVAFMRTLTDGYASAN